MENEIMIYAAGLAGFRLAILAAFGYAFYLVLKPKRALAGNQQVRSGTTYRANRVFDDHC